ncbi:EAL domain-containing protein [Pelomicrobium sp. G1]|uniref:bifunctional diguanylate cyclase/phosphodiesterase n=1 Tax=unclassified Pelomicrobium TaxID=2815318 RepID=UPI003F772F59
MRLAATGLGIAVAAALLGWVGFTTLYVHGHLPTLWLPSGLGLAAVLLFGPWAALAVFAGTAAVFVDAGMTPGAALALAGGEAAAALAGAGVLARMPEFNFGLTRLKDVLCLAGPGAVSSALVAATITAPACYGFGLIEREEVAGVWGLALASHAVGVLVLTPALLGWRARPSQVRPSRVLELACAAAAAGTLAYAMYCSAFGPLANRGIMGILLFPLLAWGALRFKPTGAALVSLAVAAGAVVGTALDGPLPGMDAPEHSLTLLVFLAAVSVTTLTLSSLYAQQLAAEQALRQGEERFRRLTELSADWYWEQDESLRYTFISGGISAAAGRRPEEYLGKTRWELPFLRLGEEALRRHRAALDARQQFRHLVVESVDRQGEVHYVSISGEPVFDAEGRFRGYRGTGADVTARVLAERALRQREAQLRLIAENVPAMIAHLDAGLRYRFANQRYAGLFGWFADRMVGRHHREVIGEEAYALVEPYFRRVLAGESASYTRVLHSEGVEREIEVILVPDSSDGQKVIGIYVMATDVTSRKQAELALKKSEQRYRALVEVSPDAIFISRNGVIEFINPAGLALLGAKSAGEILGRPLLDFIHPRDHAVVAERIAAVKAGFSVPPLEETYLRLDGTPVPVEAVASALVDEGGFAIQSIARDVSERQAAQSELRRKEALLHAAISNAPLILFTLDQEGRFTFSDGKALEALGFRPGQAVGRTLWELHGDLPAVIQQTRRVLQGERVVYEVQVAGRHFEVHSSPTHNDAGEVNGAIGLAVDITERKQAEARIQQLATRDPLTGLPNRLLLQDRAIHCLAQARRRQRRVALLFIDLDRFKTINDSLGHHVGDALLKEVANRLSGSLRATDTLSRLGGDEFLVVIQDLLHSQDAARVAEKLLDVLNDPFAVEGHTLNTSCSIGISVFPDDGEDLSTLMKNADTAMYHAKEQGRNNYQFFSGEMMGRAMRRLTMENALRGATERGEFVLHYQPQVAIGNGAVIGAEALIRWLHPERGLVPPAEFIPLAEEMGLIRPVGEWVIAAAAAQVVEWERAGLRVPRIAVNLSRAQLRPDLPDTLARILGRSALAPRRLELEITESLLMQNVDEAVAVLERIEALGVRIAIDDFGTGYSSLAVLTRLPIDAIKIDRAFVQDIEVNRNAQAVASAIIAMARSLHLTVLAEGVEREETLATLAELGCDGYQGYLRSPPLPAEEFAARFLAPAGVRPALPP